MTHEIEEAKEGIPTLAKTLGDKARHQQAQQDLRHRIEAVIEKWDARMRARKVSCSFHWPTVRADLERAMGDE